MRKIRLMAAAAILSAMMGITAYAGQWNQDTVGWWYQNDNGTYPINGLKKIDTYWYYFDKEGYMKTGWYVFANGWFGFNEDGHCMNPLDAVTGEPAGSPYEGWLSYSGSLEATINDLANGSVVYFNGQYWCDPSAYQEEIVYEHDVAPAPEANRYGLADMQF